MSKYKRLHLYHHLLRKAAKKGGRDIKHFAFIIDEGLAILCFDYYNKKWKVDKSSGMVAIPLSRKKYAEYLEVVK